MSRKMEYPIYRLDNFANNCWFNASLQVFMSMPELFKSLRKSLADIRRNAVEEEDKGYGSGKVACTFVSCYMGAMKELALQGHENEAPMMQKELLVCMLLNVCKMGESMGIRLGVQHDVAEAIELMMNRGFFRATFDEIPEEFGGDNEADKDIVRTFRGCYSPIQIDSFFLRVCFNKICPHCYNYSYEYQTNVILHLPLVVGAGKVSLDELLDEFTSCESLSEDNAMTCGKCKKLSRFLTYSFICDAPDILIIQLKRFDSRSQKIKVPVKYPAVLDLNPYFVEDPFDATMKNWTSWSKKEEPYVYDLFGVISHQGGSSSSGHYYSRVKRRGEWWYCNDEMVAKISRKAVADPENAYVLFYRLRESESEGDR